MATPAAAVLALIALSQAKPAPPAGWKPYPSAKGAYSVALPAKPVEKKRKVELPAESIELTIQSARKGPTAYWAAFGDLKAEPTDPEPVLQALLADVIAAEKAEKGTEADRPWNGHPGRELSAGIPRSVVAGGAKLSARALLVGIRVHVLVAVVPAKGGDPTDGFLASFARTDKPPAPRPVGGAAPDPKPDRPKPPAGWIAFSSEEDGFRVCLPGQPAIQEIDHDSLGEPIKVRLYISKADNLVYTILPIPFPVSLELTTPAQFDTFFAGVRKGQEAHGITIQSAERTTFKGYQAVRARFEQSILAGTGAVESLGVVAGKRFFHVNITRARGIDLAVARSKPFFDSFEPIVAANRAQAPPPGWQVHASKAGGYKAGFPTKPRVESYTTKAGIPIERARASRSDGDYFEVGFSDPPPGSNGPADREKALDGAVTSFASDGKLVASRARPLGALAGREFEVELAGDGKGAGRRIKLMRLYSTGPRLYTLERVGPEDLDRAEAAAFFDSFRMEPADPNGGVDAAPGAKEPRQIIAPKPRPGWQTYVAKDGRWEADFPIVPKDDTLTTPRGVVIHQVKAERGPGVGSFDVSFSDPPPGVPGAANPEEGLENATRALTSGRVGKVARVEAVRLGAVPGRHIEVEVPATAEAPGGTLMLIRAYAADKRVYTLFRSGPRDLDRAEAAAFLDSFRLKKP